MSVQAIHYLIKAGRLQGIEISGKTFVLREEVENFKPQRTGRPTGKKNSVKRNHDVKTNNPYNSFHDGNNKYILPFKWDRYVTLTRLRPSYIMWRGAASQCYRIGGENLSQQEKVCS